MNDSLPPLSHALQVLDFETVLSRLASECESSLGATLATELRPSFKSEEVVRLLAQTDEAFRLLATERLPNLVGIRDLREATNRAAKGATLDGQSIYFIGEALSTMRALRTVLKPKQEAFPVLWAIVQNLLEDPKTEEIILRSVDSGGEVMDSATTELAKLRRAKRNAAQRLTDKIHSYTTGSHRDHLSDPIVTQRGGRYVVPVKAEHRAKIRGIVHDTSSSGQTLFIEPTEVIEIGNALREAEAAEIAEIARILTNLSSRIGALGMELVGSIEAAGGVDLILAKARYGYRLHGCVPEASRPAHCFIELGRHPLLDEKIAIPLTMDLGGEQDGVLITGPNTGGKTVAMKTVGLFVAMSQAGMMVPARRAKMGHFSQIWADIGDEQSMQQSLSTFSAHIKNIAEALVNLKPGSLVILDEIGAGTDPAEGAALAKSVLLEIQSKRAKVLASTHYGELKLFATNTPGFINSSMEFDVKTLRPTYRLLTGTPGSSHALKIAERYGMPKEVVEKARQDQGIQEQDVAKMLEQLEHAQRRAQKAQSESDRLTHRLKEVEALAEKKLKEADEIRRTARQRVADAVEAEMRQLRMDASDLFEQLKKAAPSEVDKARARLKELNARGESLATKTRPDRPKPKEYEIHKGMSVRVRGFSQTGSVLEEPRDGKANVQLGSIKMTVKTADLEPEQLPSKPKQAARKSHQLEKAQTASIEFNLRGFRAEDAELELERFLDESILAGMDSVRIIHGKGEGILRQVTQSILKRHRGVKSFRDGESTEGGQGATIATLK